MSKLLNDKQYARIGGVKCPKCRSTNLNADTIEQDGPRAWQNIECEDCGAYWTDHYQLVGYGNFHEKDENV